VAEADTAVEGEGVAVVAHLGAGRDGAGGDGDVVLGAEVDGDLRQGYGGHRRGSCVWGAVRDVVTIPQPKEAEKGR
jgi:hypothetical protein